MAQYALQIHLSFSLAQGENGVLPSRSAEGRYTLHLEFFAQMGCKITPSQYLPLQCR
jgi:hypothetical protein